MKTIPNDITQQEPFKDVQTAHLEIFLFKYLHYERKLITDEDFKRACGDRLKGCKFPVEMQIKAKLACIQALRNFLAEKKELGFLPALKRNHPDRYDQTMDYLKRFYGEMLWQLLADYRTRRTLTKAAKLNYNFQLNTTGFKPYLRHIADHPGDPAYNSFIISGDGFGAELAFGFLRRNWQEKYPHKEVLELNGHYGITEFLKKTPEIMLENFHRLHPNLLGVLVTDLEEERLSQAEQDKLALLLKTLVKQQVQVAVSSSVWPQTGNLSAELWSCYRSGLEFTLPYRRVIYTQDLTCSLTLEQDRKRFKWLSRLFKTHSFGTLYPGILSGDDGLDFSDTMAVELGLCWLGKFTPPTYIFPRAVCPTCGKAKLTVYACIASMLSGGHVIKFHCLNCGERVATNNAPAYFRMMRTYGTRECYRAVSKRAPENQ